MITGRVQMVMFRDFVKRKASSLGVNGTVRNLNDGSVEVVAQGSKDKLEVLKNQLYKGPLLARVDKVEMVWKNPKVNFYGFHIIP